MRFDSTSERRDALLRELDESGLSMAEFCRRRGLVYGSVAAWRSASRRKPRAFVEVDSSDANPDPEVPAEPPCAKVDAIRRLAVELLLPGGIVLRIFEADQTEAKGAVQ
jgi:hypothetical protein